MWLSDTWDLEGWVSELGHRIPARAVSASLLVALLSVGWSGCKRDGADGSRAAAAEPSAKELGETRIEDLEARSRDLLRGATFPPRPEIVALSDKLAVAAAHLGPNARALHLSRSAAELRARTWRVEHREADAREAIEIYASGAKDALAQGLQDEWCQFELGRVLMSAELARDPSRLYRDLYLSSKLVEKTRCREALDRAMQTAAAYRPDQVELSRLDAQAERALREMSRPASSAPVVSSDETGVVLAPPVSANAGPVKVVSIEPYGSKDRARVVVTLSGATSYRAGELGASRLFVDLEKTTPSSRREIAVGGLVEKVRQTPRPERSGGEGAARVLLDLSGKAYRRIFYLPEPFRVVIDLATQAPSSSLAPPGAPRQVSRVALDAGHGGNDPGATGPSGLREKDVTLDIAHLAAPLLSSDLGILTMLTRDDDRLVPLDERAARANAFHADLFVSIHCNASENAAARGVMSFVLDGTRDETAATVAARENATSLAASSQVASIASGLRFPDVGARSTRFAELLQHSTMTSLSGPFGDAADHGVKTAGFFVLLGAEMPSVLFETSFISNPAEERRLGSADYRRRLAQAIVRAVRAYREGL